MKDTRNERSKRGDADEDEKRKKRKRPRTKYRQKISPLELLWESFKVWCNVYFSIQHKNKHSKNARKRSQRKYPKKITFFFEWKSCSSTEISFRFDEWFLIIQHKTFSLSQNLNTTKNLFMFFFLPFSLWKSLSSPHSFISCYILKIFKFLSLFRFLKIFFIKNIL